MKQLYLRRLLVFIAFVLLGTASFTQVVISQVYGGGGNAGATYNKDFIELFNRGTDPVDLSGWSVQYASASGTSWTNRTNLSGIIQPGQYYLISGAGGSTGINLPASDVSGTINLSGSNGKIVLVQGTAAQPSNICPTINVVDFVGYGSVNCSETAPTNSLSVTTAAIRNNNGCMDSDNNSTDFTVGVPTPRNSASSLNACGVSSVSISTSSLPSGVINESYTATFEAASGTAPYTFSLSAGSLPAGLSLSTSGTLSGVPTTGGNFDFTIKVEDKNGDDATRDFTLTIAVTATIAQIQGAGNVSPLNDYSVITSGIVTGRKSNGFFIQMPEGGDNDPSTSDAVYVFTNSTPPTDAAVGNLVKVAGKVVEYGTSSGGHSFTLTEITGPTVNLLSTGHTLPTAVTLTATDITTTGGFYQLEEYEGMRVEVASLTVVAPTGGSKNEQNATGSSNGVFSTVITGTPRPFREPGIQQPITLPGAPANVPLWDANPELITVASRGLWGANYINVASGDVLTDVSGVLDYGYGSYTIDPDPQNPPTVITNNPAAAKLPTPSADEFTVASFNLERFYDDMDDPNSSDVKLTAVAYAKRLNKLSLAIRNVLNYPDILGVVEVEKLSVLEAIATKVNSDAVAAGDPDPGYVAYLEEGNDVGGIDVGFLVKGGKVNVLSVIQYGKDATYLEPSGTESLLNDRPPLVLRATIVNPACRTPFPVTVIVNHLRSLLSMEDPVSGPRVRAKRKAQAEFLAGLIQDLQTAEPHAHIVSVGDYNAFQFNDGFVDVIGTIQGTPAPDDQVITPTGTITTPALTNLVEQLPAAERYSYIYDGSAQVLDHVLVSEGLLEHVSGIRVAHLNADYPEVLRSDANRPERLSDHDVPVAYFRFPADTEAPVITNETTSVTTLAPVNHKMREVTIGYEVSDNCDTEVTTTLSVSSNEPVNGIGDGNTAPDYEVMDNHTVRLRAERSGTGTGRTYTITITATDDAGNSSTRTVEVKVAHNAGGATNRAVATEEIAAGNLLIRALPNPSSDRFTLVSQSGSNQPLSIRVTDVMGRVVEVRNGTTANGTFQLGSDYRPGVYYVEVVQGDVRQTIRLVKQPK